VISHITASKTKKLHDPNVINGYHQPGGWKPLQGLGEASANPHRSSQVAHPMKLGVGAAIELKECTTS